MKVYEIRIKIYLLKDISVENIQYKIASFIDAALSKDEELLSFHENNEFKNYCFDTLYPIESDKVYKEGNIYTLTIRTIDGILAKYFNNKLVNEFNHEFKALTGQIRIIPKKYIDKVYSITSLIIKTEEGYWKGNLSLTDFERRIKENLIKKYNKFTNSKVDENFQLHTFIEFKNKKPIATEYKGIKLLGDKILLNISEDKISQELAYMSLGTGIGEANARGFGFVNFRWI